MLRVLPTGAKHWIWRGTVRGRRVDLGLGGLSLHQLGGSQADGLRAPEAGPGRG